MNRRVETFERLVKLRVIEIGDGYRAKNEELGGSGPIFLRAAYLQDAGFSLEQAERFRQNDLSRFGSKISTLNDVVITTKGNSTGRIGRIRAAQVGAIYSPHLSYWRVLNTEEIHPGFLYFWSICPEFRSQLASMSHSTDMAPYLSLRDQLRLKISLPPLGTQHAIAAVLNALDDKIELNRRMNETLEAMARAIFKSWFVDFGPVRAKAEGRPPPGLSPDLAALFPDALDEDDKPKGWSLTPLDEVAEFLNGLALQKFPPESEDSLPVIKIAELRSGITEKSDHASIYVPREYVVEDGDVLFSWSGSLTHLIWTAGRGALNQHLFKVTSAHFPKWFYFLWVGHHMPNFRAIAASKATTMGHIQRHHLSEALTIVPNREVMQAANSVIAPLFDRLIANDLESRSLAAIRDLLLPKLMSGEIRVKDAEKIVAAKS